MPIFPKKILPKAAPLRGIRLNSGCQQVQEEINDIKDINLSLNDKNFVFVDGLWISSTKSKKNDINLDDVTKIRMKLKLLEEENNLYQVKIDVLLDMLTENMSELNLLKNIKNHE